MKILKQLWPFLIFNTSAPPREDNAWFVCKNLKGRMRRMPWHLINWVSAVPKMVYQVNWILWSRAGPSLSDRAVIRLHLLLRDLRLNTLKLRRNGPEKSRCHSGGNWLESTCHWTPFFGENRLLKCHILDFPFYRWQQLRNSTTWVGNSHRTLFLKEAELSVPTIYIVH